MTTVRPIWVFAGLALAASGCRRGDEPQFASGVFEATEIIVSSEATGRLLEFSVVEGQELAQGARIGKVDCKQLELQRDLLVTRMKGLGTRVTDVRTQTAALKQQIAAGERELKRLETLAASGAATAKQLDDVNAHLAVLRRQVEAAEQSLRTGNRVLVDERETMQIQLAQLDDQLARCELKSPAAGTVLVKYAQQGEFTATGKPLFKLADTRHMFLRAYLTAGQVTQLELGQPVKLRADFGAEGSRDYEGRVAWVSNKAEFTPKTIQTRDERANQVYAVKVAVSNDGFLKLGMYGFIPTGADNAGRPGAEPR